MTVTLPRRHALRPCWALERDARGASLVEYLLLVGLVAVVALAALRGYGAVVGGKARELAACVATLDCASGEHDARPRTDATSAPTRSERGTPLVRSRGRDPAGRSVGQSPGVAAEMDAIVLDVIALRRRGDDIPERLLPTDHPWVEGNKAELLVDGDQVFSNILGDLSSATDSIHIAHYQIKSDALGRDIGRILMEKARAGVEVRVLADPIGSDNLLRRGATEEMLAEWERAGVQVIRNHHIAPLRKAERLNHIEHRKFYVIDGKVAYTGGMGIVEVYRSSWHDVMIRVQGEAARQMQVDFLKAWQHLGGRIDQRGGSDADLARRFFPEAGRPGDAPLQGLSQIPGESAAVRQVYLREIDAARESFYLENPYLTDPRVLDALARAAKRGVDVTIVVPGETDMPPTQWAARAGYDELLRAGASVYEYRGMTHAKVAARDAEWATIGSANLDSLSLNHNYEFNYQTTDAELVADIHGMIARDTARSRRVELGEVRGARKILYEIVSKLGYFM